MDKMRSRLDLSDDQVSKLQSQQDNFKRETNAINENTTLSQEEKKKQIMDLKNKNKEGEKNILAAEQLRKRE